MLARLCAVSTHGSSSFVGVRRVTPLVFVWFMGRSGIPFDRERLLLWIVVAWRSSLYRPSVADAARMLLDWSIFIIGVTLYDFARGRRPVRRRPGPGHSSGRHRSHHRSRARAHGVAAAALPRSAAPWWDAAASIIYASHFILPFVVVGHLVRHEPQGVGLVREPLPRALLPGLRDVRPHPDCATVVREPDRRDRPCGALDWAWVADGPCPRRAPR